MTSVAALDQIISKVLRVPIDKITPELSIHKVDTWNSLTHIEFIVTIEEQFKIQLTQDEITTMTNIAEVRRILLSRGVLSR